jgi:hypothetical protein
LVVAFAISIAIHEVLAGFVGRPFAAPPAERERVARVTIARIVPPPTPTPKPTPPPPTPPPNTYTHAPIVVARAAPHAAIHRVAAPQAQPQIVPAANASPAPPAQSGEGTGTGDKSGAGSPGEGGTGTGGGMTEPCGGVTFTDHGSHTDPATHARYETIRLSVSFPDGHTESSILDYPFHYVDAASDPWSEQNRSNPDFPTLLQTPPPALASGEPPLVQYVVKHTAADGFTLMPPCPGAAPH